MQGNRAIFITNQFGPKRIYDDEGYIGEFKDTFTNIIRGVDDGIKRRAGDAMWVMVLTDPGKIERIRKYPSFLKGAIKEVEKEPVYKTLNNVRTIQDPNSASSILSEALAKNDIEKAKLEKELAIAQSEKQKMAQYSRRYGELYSKIIKADGGYRNSATPDLIQEFEDLKERLGIVEEKIE